MTGCPDRGLDVRGPVFPLPTPFNEDGTPDLPDFLWRTARRT